MILDNLKILTLSKSCPMRPYNLDFMTDSQSSAQNEYYKQLSCVSCHVMSLTILNVDPKVFILLA